MASDLFDGRRRGSFLRPWPAVERLPTRLDGLVLIAPTVHGDERGFFVETWREDAWAAARRRHRRSSRTTTRARAGGRCAASTSRRHPGQGKLVRVARGQRAATSSVDLRRGSPTFGEWEARRARRRRRHHQLWIPVGFGHGFCVLSETPTSSTSAPPTTTRRPRPGSASTTREVGIEWPQDVELLYSERDRDAPPLAEVADGAAVPVRVVSAPTAASPRRPTGTLHLGNLRTALLAWLFARSAGARFLRAHGGPRPRAACAPGIAEQQLEDLARDRARLGRPGRVPVRAGARSTARRSSTCGPRAACTSASARAPRSARRASAPHGPLPEGAYPGHVPAADARRARAQARRRPAARAARARRRARASRSPTGCWAAWRASSTTSWSRATTARRPTTSRSWSTTPRRASARSCAAPTSLDSTPRQLCLARAARAARAGVRARPARARAATARGWPSATARSRCSDLDPADARGAGWRARSGCPTRRRASCSPRSTRTRLPREPIRFGGTASLRAE